MKMKVIIVTRIDSGNRNYLQRINVNHIISYREISYEKYKVSINLSNGDNVLVCDSVNELDKKINYNHNIK